MLSIIKSLFYTKIFLFIIIIFNTIYTTRLHTAASKSKPTETFVQHIRFNGQMFLNRPLKLSIHIGIASDIVAFHVVVELKLNIP